MAQVVQFAAQSYQARSLPLDAQRCVNMYPEFAPKGAKTPVPVWGCPGLVAFAVCGAGPVQGWCMMNDVLYVVSGQSFWQVNRDGSSVNLGSTLVSGPVSIATNGVQVCWVDGQAGWYWSAATGVHQISDPNFYPADTVVFFDGYFVFNRSGTKEFFLSPIYAVTPFDGALFASKEATPDLLVGIVNSHEQLYLFGQERGEVWFDAGNQPPTFPFQRFDGAFIQRGLAAPLATALEDNTVFFLGEDLIFYRLEGFTPVRVSTHATEKAWQSYQTMRDARCFAYTIEGHKLINLVCPSGPASWVYDIATGLWHERESWLGGSEDTSIGRWRGNCAIAAYDRVLIGDSQSGTIGALNFQAYTELGATMRGLITSPPIHADRKRVFMKRFEIEVETGVGLPGASDQVSVPYAVNPVVITAPTELATAAALQNLPANFSSALFSVWVYLPDDGGQHGFWFSNQGSDAPGHPGPGLQIGAFNDQTGTPQLVVNAWDANGAPIVAAAYDVSSWAAWTNLMVSIDTATQQLQVWANSGTAQTLLSAASLTWSSANPIANPAAAGWHLVPAA